MPPLELHIERTNGAQWTHMTVEIVRPDFYGETEALLALVADVVDAAHPLYERQTMAGSGTTTPVLFSEEHRYIGYALVPPSDDAAESRTVFLRVGPNGDIHRISIKGTRTTIRSTSWSSARAKLPQGLTGRRPVPPDPQWDVWFDSEVTFYNSLEWKPSRDLTLVELRRSSERDVLVIKLVVKHDS